MRLSLKSIFNLKVWKLSFFFFGDGGKVKNIFSDRGTKSVKKQNFRLFRPKKLVSRHLRTKSLKIIWPKNLSFSAKTFFQNRRKFFFCQKILSYEMRPLTISIEISYNRYYPGQTCLRQVLNLFWYITNWPNKIDLRDSWYFRLVSSLQKSMESKLVCKSRKFV